MNMIPQQPQLILRDIHLPPAVSWFPPAIGWWILLALVLLAIFAVVRSIRRYRRRRYVRIALQQLADLEQEFNQHQDTRQLVIALSKLLRHMAILHYPAHQCAGLHNQDWLIFLDQPFRDKKSTNSTPFSNGVGQCLVTLPYQSAEADASHSDINATELLDLARRWMKQLPLTTPSGREQ